MKAVSNNNPSEKAVFYQGIYLFVAAIDIYTRQSLDQCAGQKLCRDDMWNQSKNG